MRVPTIKQLQSYLDRETGTASARAASIAARYDSSLLAFVALRSELEPAPPFTSQARFLAYSITKTFTAVAVLKLAAAGKLELDSPLGHWLPGAPHAERITVRQCLQHTSGLPDYGGLPEYHRAVGRGERPWTFDEFLAKSGADRLLFEPGQDWRYSNIGYMLLRRLIETVGAESYGAVLRAEILVPLELFNTSVPESREDLSALVFGPSASFEDKAVRSRYDPRWIPTGVVAATAADLAVFYHSLFTGKLLPPHLLEQMRLKVPMDRASLHPMFTNPGYGLGLMIVDSPCGTLYGHTGAGPGASAAAFHCRSEKYPLTVVALTNGEDPRQAEHIVWVVCSNLTAPE